MIPRVVLEPMLLILAGLLLVGVWWSHHRQSRALRAAAVPKQPRTMHCYPSVTVIRPIKGLDAGIEENIRAALDHGYPGRVETLFVFDDAGDPTVPVVTAALSGEPEETGRIIFAGSPPPNRTGKLNAMIVGLREARGELVAFADSDIRPDRGALTALIDSLLDDPGAGAAFSPVIATAPPRTFGDAGYDLMINGLYAPAAAVAAARRGGTLPFIMGQFMVFRRQALRAVGGLECAEGQLVDDMYLGACVTAAGYRNRVAPRPVPVIEQGMSGRAFAGTFVRWITFSRSGLPGRDFKLAGWLTAVTYWTGLVGALIALLSEQPVPALALAAVPLAVAASIERLHIQAGGSPLAVRHLAVPFALLLATPIVYLAILGRREVVWRGRRYRLDASSRLASGGAGDGIRAPAGLTG